MAGPLDAGRGWLSWASAAMARARAPSMAQMTALGMTPGADAGDPRRVDRSIRTTAPSGRRACSRRSCSGTRARTRSTRSTCTSRRTNYEYQGYFAANTTPFVNLPIPEAGVERRRRYSNSGEPLTISLVFAQGANVVRAVHRDVDDRAGDAAGDDLLQLVRHGAREELGLERQLRQPVRRGHARDHVRRDGADARGGRRLARADGTAPAAASATRSRPTGKSLVTQARTPTPRTTRTRSTSTSPTTRRPAPGRRSRRQNLTFPALYKDGSLLLSSSGGMIDGDSRRASSTPCRPGRRSPASPVCRPNFRRRCRRSRPTGRTSSFNFWGGSLTATRHDAQRRQRLARDPRLRRESAFSNPRSSTRRRRHVGDVLVVLPEQRRGRLRGRALERPSGHWGVHAGNEQHAASSGGSTSRPRWRTGSTRSTATPAAPCTSRTTRAARTRTRRRRTRRSTTSRP